MLVMTYDYDFIGGTRRLYSVTSTVSFRLPKSSIAMLPFEVWVPRLSKLSFKIDELR